MADGRSLTSGTPDGSVQHDLFHIGEDLPPAMPERAAWGTAPKPVSYTHLRAHET